MSQHQAALNRVWTHVLLEECYRQGVRHVCIAPGSRSTPLTLEAVKHPGLTVHTHFDERGLGFLALGLAKSTHSPVAVIVTSGTAVANLLPAVAESNLTKEPLILLTSDRPTELVGCGANQAIEQTGIFSQHITHALNLPSPTTQAPLSWLLTSIDYAFAEQRLRGASIHVNCPFPEPLYGGEDTTMFADYLAQVSAWRDSDDCYSEYGAGGQHHDYTHSVDSLNLIERQGVIIIGSVSLAEAQQALSLAKRLGWPVLCDPQSGASDGWQRYDIWLQNANANAVLSQADFILQVGARLVSKRLLSWIDRQVEAGCEYVLLSPLLECLNPSHLRQKQLNVNLNAWLSSATLALPSSSFSGWADELIGASQAVVDKLPCLPHVTEFDVAASIERLPVNVDLFIGNSLIVRLVDMLTSVPCVETYSNRGASGIDGLVATAAGVQSGNGHSLVLYIGDTSLLYDLNSLALFTRTTQPCVIVVTNNDGGAIFDMLPAPSAQKSQYYQMPHGYQFHHAAAQFGLQYQTPTDKVDLESTMAHHLTHGEGTLLIEVTTQPHEVGEMIRQLGQSAASDLNYANA
ncbi:2-succinyl-5-enolpyruvyl-6-hydroxy-3-cyclohexene-1-carboxylic-acid synthase [Vibrio sp. 10N]|uniref:2-succinyl-5-enolpyruvyl-6-hydroxy-3- cyclohexene-1-carboxylic-acid synthase n=1 Tax=Vibrio sp. 10N TaxID=3058938 RepID=UPI002813BDD5|nr:2-succinyl-5-enolpyruvyl-6-hydroxy-3-cyclohexene- 1-carboxylic-acid synthase [Vibrio sp. 10N]